MPDAGVPQVPVALLEGGLGRGLHPVEGHGLAPGLVGGHLQKPPKGRPSHEGLFRSTQIELVLGLTVLVNAQHGIALLILSFMAMVKGRGKAPSLLRGSVEELVDKVEHAAEHPGRLGAPAAAVLPVEVARLRVLFLGLLDLAVLPDLKLVLVHLELAVLVNRVPSDLNLVAALVHHNQDHILHRSNLLLIVV